MCFVTFGASHVAEISATAETPRSAPIMPEERPSVRRYVIICPENDKTVIYSSANDKDGRKTG
jgi:hypothetical protein